MDLSKEMLNLGNETEANTKTPKTEAAETDSGSDSDPEIKAEMACQALEEGIAKSVADQAKKTVAGNATVKHGPPTNSSNDGSVAGPSNSADTSSDSGFTSAPPAKTKKKLKKASPLTRRACP